VSERIEGLPFFGDTFTARVEQYIKLYVKPRPAWMPEILYRWIMSRVVLYESLPMVTLLPKHLADARSGDPK
jgi:hypothetical protein